MSEKEIKKFIDEAYKEALKAYSKDEVPVGAVIVKDGKIIGRGHNLRVSENNALLHAEIVAIQDACKNINNWRLDGATLIVTNEPCVMCTGAIMQSRISKVIFCSLNQKMGAILSNFNILDYNNITFKVEYKHMYDERCSRILKDYFQHKRGRNSEKDIVDSIYNNDGSD
ncbi:nucleoside deaminase [Persephonella sp.]|uniref:nucleoside deaminase n=1 Tax=Persephonella sp. TaxID=2060922 RepID=UPI00260D7D88|nr:nucleoside deaminase [Persephonella sp.]